MTADESGSQIVNTDHDWTGVTEDGSRWKRLGRAAGGDLLGCTIEEMRSDPLPYHYHTANEEAMYVLSGRGTLRTPTGEVGIDPGDYVSFPVGESGAHTVENAFDEPLRFLVFSTMNESDVVIYPDEEKLQVYTGAAPGRPDEEFSINKSFSFDE